MARRARSEPEASGVPEMARRARSEAEPSRGQGAGRSARRAWAAWLAAAALLALAAPQEPRGGADCPQPREAEARAGHSVAARCGAAGPGRPLRGPARRLFALPIDLGSADAPTLETLPGIGPRRAEAILRERARAPFAAPEELERVPGIGPRTVAGLAGLVAVGAPE